jgi:hypothetical protein
MPVLQVDSFQFAFAATVVAHSYDQWQHYLNVWNTAGRNQKAVDVVAVENPAAPTNVWLIEAKDFRIISHPPRPSNLAQLPETVAIKVEHTLAGLADAAVAAADALERSHASIAIAARTKRIVLHLEPHTGQHTALFPARFSANVLQKLKQLVKTTDPNPLVLDIEHTPGAGVPWTVA